MKKNLAKKITLSILAGAMLMSSSVAWAANLDDKYIQLNQGLTSFPARATGTNAIAIGGGAEASGEDSNAMGSGAEASGEESNAIGFNATASGKYSNAIGTNATASGIDSNAIGYDAEASGKYSNAIGIWANATQDCSNAIGFSAEATGIHSNAIGTSAEASGKYSNAFGYDAKASAEGAIALGYGSVANEENVVSVGSGVSNIPFAGPEYRKIINVADGVNLHDAVTVGQMNTELDKKADKATTLAGYGITDAYTKNEADGKFATITALGDYAKTADVANTYATKDALTNGLANKADKATTLAGYGITDAYTKNEVDNALTGKANAADVYKKGETYSKTEVNTELNKKADKNDVYTKAEVYNKSEIDNMIATPAGIDGINQRIDKTNAKINKVGAGAAALAALHPLDYDPDDKLTFSAGMGNYAGENAAALGAFYRPNEKFMVSLGGTMGNGENMVNLGLSIGLDKPNGYAKLSKRELIQKVNVMEAKYEQVEAENEAMKAEMAEMKAMLQELLAKK